MKKVLSIFGSLLLTLVFTTNISAAELIVNGGFETPVVDYNSWGVFPIGTEGLGWSVEYLTPDPYVPQGLEIQNNLDGAPREGNQLAELDSYHPTRIWQDIPTKVGYKYEIKYSWIPRHEMPDNQMMVKWGDEVIGTHIASWTPESAWQDESVIMLSTGDVKRLEFTETGADDSFGMFLDAVSVNEISLDSDNDGVLDQVDCDPLNDMVSVLLDSKACQLYKSGVEGEGVLNAHGLQKPFNPNSQASVNAGKKK